MRTGVTIRRLDRSNVPACRAEMSAVSHLGESSQMGTVFDQQFEHLLRRAGFGARPDELATFRTLSFNGAVDRLVNYEQIADDVDSKIFQPGYVGVTSPPGIFAPGAVITDPRPRWLFPMGAKNRPLQEKMTLFWHNHFATAYSKIAGT